MSKISFLSCQTVQSNVKPNSQLKNKDDSGINRILVKKNEQLFSKFNSSLDC